MLKKILSSLITGLVTFILIYLIATFSNLFIGMERGVLNGLFYLREPNIGEINPYVSDRVQLLGYDENSIAEIGKWPWKRYVHAEFIDKIQRFSPEIVFIDIIFAKPESVPNFITDKLRLAPKAMEQVKAAFAGMDEELARALSRYDNVYLDQQLVEEQRESLPDDFKKRIALNEKILEDYSQPSGDVMNPVIFNSLEPILSDYVKNAHPSVINVLADEDGVVRLFPLFYTYRLEDGSHRNVFSVVLLLLQQYYHIDKDQISLRPDKVILNGVKAPILDPDTQRTVQLVRDAGLMTQTVINPNHPAGYAYNTNLYRYLLYQLKADDARGQKAPHLPLHVLERIDGKTEIIDGWEIFDAARDAGADSLDIIPYRERNIVIETPVTGFFPINYAGKDERFFLDSSGKLRSHTTIPTDGYRSVYTMDELVDVPELDIKGNIKPGDGLKALSRWYYQYCLKKSEEVYKHAGRELGENIDDPRQVRDYMNRNPEDGKYYFYSLFFKKHNANPDTITSLFKGYAAWSKEVGQPEKYVLNRGNMISALMDAYGEGFHRYYNQFIFTGGNATGLGDVQQTPYAGMFGVNVIINAFNTIAINNPLIMSQNIPSFDTMLLGAFCLVTCLLYGLTGIRTSGVLFVLSLGGIFLFVVGVFYGASIFISTTPIIFADAGVFVIILGFKLLTEEKDKRFIKETFGTYLAPELIQEMHNTRTMPKLGGEAKIITAFFTDIQGFSTFSEKLTAHQLVDLLNEYMTAMTDILIGDKGTLDKYEGDAIIAFFGAPMELADQEVRACRVAVNMQKKLGELREKWQNEKTGPGEPNPNVRNVPTDQWIPGDRWPRVVHAMRMRIGINTGEIVVGNMGSSTRMNYTMMGDPVNLSARLEAAAKQYGMYNLVSEYTLDVEYMDEAGEPRKVKDMVETRFLDHITVVGKSEPVRVYELLAMKGELSGKEKELIAVFEEGMQYYQKMQWEKAIELFSRSYSLERFPFEKTTPSEVFIYRCRKFKEKPPVEPGKKWDGVFRLSKK